MRENDNWKSNTRFEELILFQENVSKLPGPRGPRGFSGSSGPQGPRGYNGSNGTPGAPGAPGVPGKPGSIGPSGFNGTRGPKGTTGSQGPPGPRGAGNFSSCILGKVESWANQGTDNDASVSDVMVRICFFLLLISSLSLEKWTCLNWVLTVYLITVFFNSSPFYAKQEIKVGNKDPVK